MSSPSGWRCWRGRSCAVADHRRPARRGRIWNKCLIGPNSSRGCPLSTGARTLQCALIAGSGDTSWAGHDRPGAAVGRRGYRAQHSCRRPGGAGGYGGVPLAAPAPTPGLEGRDAQSDVAQFPIPGAPDGSTRVPYHEQTLHLEAPPRARAIACARPSRREVGGRRRAPELGLGRTSIRRVVAEELRRRTPYAEIQQSAWHRSNRPGIAGRLRGASAGTRLAIRRRTRPPSVRPACLHHPHQGAVPYIPRC